MNGYRCLMIALIVILCAGVSGCSKSENERSASVSVKLEDNAKELPRLEQNYVYERSLAEEEQEPSYFHESPDPLTPMSDKEQQKAAPSTV